MPGPYPREFREDVVAVARSRESGVTIKQIATDFGISEATLQNWLRQADVEEGNRPGQTAADAAEARELKKRIRLLEQENEVLRRAAAYLSQANLKLGGGNVGPERIAKHADIGIDKAHIGVIFQRFVDHRYVVVGKRLHRYITLFACECIFYLCIRLQRHGIKHANSPAFVCSS